MRLQKGKTSTPLQSKNYGNTLNTLLSLEYSSSCLWMIYRWLEIMYFNIREKRKVYLKINELPFRSKHGPAAFSVPECLQITSYFWNIGSSGWNENRGEAFFLFDSFLESWEAWSLGHWIKMPNGYESLHVAANQPSSTPMTNSLLVPSNLHR